MERLDDVCVISVIIEAVNCDTGDYRRVVRVCKDPGEGKQRADWKFER